MNVPRGALLTCAFVVAAALLPSCSNERPAGSSNQRDRNTVIKPLNDHREQLTDAIWPDGRSIGPSTQSRSGMMWAAKRTLFRFELDLGVVTEATLLSRGQRCLVIVHEGHRGSWTRGEKLIRGILEHCDVYGVSMPLIKPDSRQIRPPDVTEKGSIALNDHDDFWQANEASTLSIFLEPVIRGLDAMNYRRVGMIGISGGGWTTVWVAAMDNRVDWSVSVSGTLPLHLLDRASWGDWEQATPAVYKMTNYLTLYALAADDSVHSMVQIAADDCCFAGDHSRDIAPPVNEAVAGRGEFRYVVDDWADHSYSPAVTRLIMEFVRRDSGPHSVYGASPAPKGK